MSTVPEPVEPGATASCLYEGVLRHRRMQPNREFRHRLVMSYIDLDELPTLLSGRLMRRTPGLMRFRRADYHGDSRVPLAESVRATVAEHLERRPSGPIRVLTNLRSLGHCFNPVSFYFCFDHTGRSVEVVLAEVTNTPWGERQAYVIPSGVGRFQKTLHVSPFMGMDQVYSCRAGVPSQTLSVMVGSDRGEERLFEASLALRRIELTPASVRSVSRRYPLATLRTQTLIYAHAFGLWLARVPVFPHPAR